MVLKSSFVFIAQNVAQLFLNVPLFRLLRAGGSSYLLIMKTSGALSEIAASPLLAYGAVFRTLLVLQAQTRGVIRAA